MHIRAAEEERQRGAAVARWACKCV